MTKHKLRADYIHFMSRLMERYGLEMSQDEYKTIVHLIENNVWHKYCVGKLTGTRSLYRIPFADTEIEVVYSSAQKSLVTCLPSDVE